MEKKYEFTDEVVDYYGRKLHRIEALRDFGHVKKGDKGGLIEKEDNLSHVGECWVYSGAMVYGNAKILDDGWVCHNAVVRDNAEVRGKGIVGGHAMLLDNAKVCDAADISDNVVVRNNAVVCGLVDIVGRIDIGGDAIIANTEDYITFNANWCTEGDIVYTRSNKKYKVGCSLFSDKELISAGYRQSKKMGECYERLVEYVDNVYRIIDK